MRRRILTASARCRWSCRFAAGRASDRRRLRIGDLPETPGTFSILGFDPETGEIGAAVQSRVFSVGNGVLWAEAGVGAVATQAIVDVSYGPKGHRAAQARSRA